MEINDESFKIKHFDDKKHLKYIGRQAVTPLKEGVDIRFSQAYQFELGCKVALLSGQNLCQLVGCHTCFVLSLWHAKTQGHSPEIIRLCAT